MTAPAAGAVTGECRHCAEPIRLVPGRSAAWIHDGPHGAFYCRDKHTGLFLPAFAQPTEPPRPVAGRHAAGVAPGTATQQAAQARE